MSLTIDCLKRACDLEKISYKLIDETGSVMVVMFPNFDHLAINTRLGLLTDAEWQLFRDKYYSYQLFGQDKLFPVTRAYIDPDAISHFAQFASNESVTEMASMIATDFKLPVMVKRNSGTQAQNVFLCTNKEEIEQALNKIYSKQQLEYDHVALVQNYIKPKAEYRIVVFESKIEFSYFKPHHSAEWGGKIEPKLVADKRFQSMVDQVCMYYPIRYAGLDVIEDEAGKLSLIEINGSPTYSSFIKANGDELVVGLFRKIIAKLNMQLGHCPST